MTSIASLEDLKELRRQIINSLYKTEEDDEERFELLVYDLKLVQKAIENRIK